ncbi:hypothetical protein BV25DRAFT_1994533 [Artomyces pyxidatus]|uniref:Uncharacterized protein n=1 Tax=Artomyces pyxidatus TaxID=48021 RepID=A0ACB8SNQ4_9AGAM|nr:hypothetical protein BV25DRAFT_1994533 [Artomyces pyxidatus]
MLTSRPVSFTADGPVNHAKTPGRALQKNRGALQENALHHGARTTNVKSFKASFQTPLRDESMKPQKLFQGTQPLKGGGPATLSRPLLDKTPFPNRQLKAVTPIPSNKKAGMLPAMDQHLTVATPGHLLRPSSTRKSVRARRSSGPNFETPITNGNHWDVSDMEIEVPAVDEVQEEQAETEDYDEIEYMPPTAIERPYEPAFEMPDYTVVGAQLFKLMHSHTYDDANDLYFAADKERMDEGLLESTGFSTSPSHWKYFKLPELDDDSPFGRAIAGPMPSTKPKSSSTNFPPSAAPHARTATVVKAPLPSISSRSVSTSRPPTRSVPLSRAPSTATSTVRGSNVTTSGRAALARTSRPATALARAPVPSRTTAPSSRQVVQRPATSASVRTVKTTVPSSRPTTSTSRGPMAKMRPLNQRVEKKVSSPASVDDIVLAFEERVNIAGGEFIFDV